MIQPTRVLLDNILTLSSAPLVQPGTIVRSIYFANIPAGVTVSMALGQKNEFPVEDGMSFDMSDDEWTSGVWLITSAAFVGQYISVVLGTGPCGGLSVTAGK